MFYEIHDTHGAPQCGCEVKRFAEWDDMAEYVYETPGVIERIDEMYATIVERYEPCYLLETENWPYYAVVTPDELPGMWADAIEYGYGSESTFENWLDDMQSQRILTCQQ